MSDNQNTEPASTDDAPAWTPPEGHTTTLPDAITDAAASPIAWDESLPADGIVEHHSPSEVVFSMVDETGKGDPLHQDPAAVMTAGAHEVPQPPHGAAPEREPAKKTTARKSPAKKAAAKKAPAKKAAKKAT